MASMLTDGATLMIRQYEFGNDSDATPVVPVWDMKVVRTPNSGDGSAEKMQRYRTVLSDGTYKLQGMVATQLNHLVDSGSLRLESIVRLEKFVCSYVKDRH